MVVSGLLFSVLLLSGCSILDRTLEFAGYGKSSLPETPENLAMEGLDAFRHGQYYDALRIFEDVKERYPFSSVSLLAELKAADCHYYMKEYGQALGLYQEYEGNHPTNEAIPYVIFQIGRCYYEQIDTIDRDPASAVNAIEAFSRLIRTYPGSPYIEEAKARLRAARNFLAGHELYVANFYVRTEEFKQAEGRLEYLLANYPDAAVAPRAKALLAALKSGNPPRRTWRSWLPEISLPSWKSFSKGVIYGPGGGGQ